MKKAYRTVRDCVYHNPLPISLMDKHLQKIADSYLPYSTGIEIECCKCVPDDGCYPFSQIADLHSEQSASDVCEARVRLLPGYQGMIGLWRVCQVLERDFYLNKSSGIHYHIGLPFSVMHVTDFMISVNSRGHKIISSGEIRDFVIKELDKWNYTGIFMRHRDVSMSKESWVRISMYQTLEFRIGEQSFDYEVLIKRILHAQRITRWVTKQVLSHTKA